MTFPAPDPTFRDPSGSLVLEQGRAIRSIRPSYKAEVLEFLHSPLYQRAVERGDMVGSTVEDGPAGLRLVHPLLRIPTYPWEWSPSQWVAAALLTLRLCREGLDDGWILKDATPLNILFVGTRPVLVDVLSFERRDPARPLWLAYGQYVRTFLLPLLARKMLHWPLELSLLRRDGYEPAEVYAAMGWAQRLSPTALWPVTLPSLLERRNPDGAAATGQQKAGKDPEMALHSLKSALDGLRKRTENALPLESRSAWSDYASTLTHYTAEQSEQKRVWVQAVLDEVRPQYVLDVGANTGEYSALACASGADVVAIERDSGAAERLFRMGVAKGLSLQTIHADLARPTPALGWENRESSALLPRLEGQFDLVMLLAVIHHLVLLEQIPLSAILSLCHRLTRCFLLIEWVPATDPMFISLMRGREKLYGSLSEQDLLDAASSRFTTVHQQPLGNGRILYLFERISP